MSNIENTELDYGDVQVHGCEFADELLTLAGVDEIKAGTILARLSTTLKLVLYVKSGGSNGSDVAKCVLAHDVSSTTSGSHDEPVRVITSGIVDKGRLIIDADGDGSNVDAAVTDQLRDYGITSKTVSELGRVDNPQPEVEES